MKRVSLIAVLLAGVALGDVRLPPFTRQVLPNGVVVQLMPRAGVPLVGFRILVNGGAEAEPASLPGVASVTAQLLRKGTAKRTALKRSHNRLPPNTASAQTNTEFFNTIRQE